MHRRVRGSIEVFRQITLRIDDKLRQHVSQYLGGLDRREVVAAGIAKAGEK